MFPAQHHAYGGVSKNKRATQHHKHPKGVSKKTMESPKLEPFTRDMFAQNPPNITSARKRSASCAASGQAFEFCVVIPSWWFQPIWKILVKFLHSMAARFGRSTRFLHLLCREPKLGENKPAKRHNQMKQLKGGQPILKALRFAMEKGNCDFLQSVTFDFWICTYNQASRECFPIWLWIISPSRGENKKTYLKSKTRFLLVSKAGFFRSHLQGCFHQKCRKKTSFHLTGKYFVTTRFNLSRSKVYKLPLFAWASRTKSRLA